MKSPKKAFLYGFLFWLIVFVVAFAIFPVREANRPFFESIMPVVISLVTVFFSVKYFSSVENNFVKEGVYVGAIIIIVNVMIDAALILSPSPMQMSVSEYFFDIGFTYLMILPITTGFGWMIKSAHSKQFDN